MARLRRGVESDVTSHQKTPQRPRIRGRYQANTPRRPGRIQKAKEAVSSGMSVRDASFVYNVARSTISDHCREVNKKAVGRPTVLSTREEAAIADHLIVQAEWGFPLTKMEVQMAIKHFLDKSGREEKRFKDNFPGDKWIRLFLNRHPNLQSKVPRLVSASRAKVDPATVNKYFDNLERTISGIPPENILNFDETSISDDPAAKTVIIKRGTKYPVKVMTTSKTAVSVMFAGTASGHMFPPYVVYKAKGMSEAWVTGGPEGTRYNRTPSGWFDKEIFQDWFESLVVPWARRLEGVKVVIGDNVSSHFSESVFKTCKEHNVLFVCLPPNSTHFLQPLDVSFFGPLKSAWKRILAEWKSDSRNRTLTIPKPSFPALLRKLVDAISGRSERNLKSAFRATGIYPLDKQQALKQIPGGVASPSQAELYRRVSDTFVEQLQSQRYGGEKGKRGRNLRLSPGKSYAHPTGGDQDEEDADDPEPEPDVHISTTPQRQRHRRRRQLAVETKPKEPTRKRHREGTQPTAPVGNAEASEVVVSAPVRERAVSRRREQVATGTTQPLTQPDLPGTTASIEPKEGDWVLVKGFSKREKVFSVGQVSGVDEHHDLVVKLLTPTEKNLFVWPASVISKSFDYSEVVHTLTEPKKLKKKGAPLRFDFSFEDIQLR